MCEKYAREFIRHDGITEGNVKIQIITDKIRINACNVLVFRRYYGYTDNFCIFYLLELGRVPTRR